MSPKEIRKRLLALRVVDDMDLVEMQVKEMLLSTDLSSHEVIDDCDSDSVDFEVWIAIANACIETDAMKLLRFNSEFGCKTFGRASISDPLDWEAIRNSMV